MRTPCRECVEQGQYGCSYCQPEREDCPRCHGLGSEGGTSDPCSACEGRGWV